MDDHDQALNGLARPQPREKDDEDKIPLLDESLKQSDVREHLKGQLGEVQ